MTGVQTCALPISGLNNSFLLKGRIHSFVGGQYPQSNILLFGSLDRGVGLAIDCKKFSGLSGETISWIGNVGSSPLGILISIKIRSVFIWPEMKGESFEMMSRVYGPTHPFVFRSIKLRVIFSGKRELISLK